MHKTKILYGEGVGTHPNSYVNSSRERIKNLLKIWKKRRKLRRQRIIQLRKKRVMRILFLKKQKLWLIRKANN